MFAKLSKKQNILYIYKHHVCVDLEQIPGLAYFISGSELIKVPRKNNTYAAIYPKIQIHLIVDSRGKDELNLHEICLEIVFLMFENNATGCEH